MKTTVPHSFPTVALILVLLLLLVYRTLYGLCSEFWSADEVQIYLLGLKYYTTGLWPYFGPDVVYTQSQIPGALQSLLVALPLFVCPVPEAPTVFLNLLTFGSLTLLAWYLWRRFPDLPRWWVWIWPLTCPWAMIYSTRVFNPGYALVFSTLFLLAFWETIPLYREKIIPPRPCFFLMGFTIAAVMQLHLSFVILVVLAGAAFFFRFREDRRSMPLLTVCFLAGFLIGISTLIPTVVVYGINGTGGVEQNVRNGFSHGIDLLLMIPKFFFFGAFQIHYMVPDPWSYLIQNHFWLFLVAAVLEAIGWIQLVLFMAAFFSSRQGPEWVRARRMTTCILGFLFFSFLFSIKGPDSHTFYILFPLSILYSFHCYRDWIKRFPGTKRLLAFCLIAGFVFHIGLSLDGIPRSSLYKDRRLVVQAIEQRDYRIMGLRRTDQWGHGY